MRERWMVQSKRADFQKLAAELGINVATARILRNRDLTDAESMRRFLLGTMADIPDAESMKDLVKTAEILLDKILQEKPIRVIGDYDCDGVCSTFILVRGLQRLGGIVDSDIPHRIRDGYGISSEMIARAAADGIDTIVTCDNGISASTPIREAVERGMTVLVTDHHDIPYVQTLEGKRWYLPPAAAVIDPKQEDCAYPFKQICGAAIAYKLIRYLYLRTGISAEELKPFIEAVALATDCDVMPLLEENRILVKAGLESMKDSRIPGLKALIEETGLADRQIKSYHLGFVLGPCLNAGGRLDTAKKALDLFLAPDEETAAPLAAELKELNEERKILTEQGVADAEEALERDGLLGDAVYVIYLPDCHESLAGIIAGRIREKYSHPTFVMTRGETCVKGSGRSIEGYPMYDALNECEDLLLKFGGHPMAAGFSLNEEDIPAFRRRLNENCRLSESDFIPTVWIDVPVPFGYVTEELMRELSLFEPCGTGNPQPRFAQKDLAILKMDVVGKMSNVGRFELADANGLKIPAVLFRGIEDMQRELEARFGGDISRATLDVVYRPEINEHNGKRTLQMQIEHWQLR